MEFTINIVTIINLVLEVTYLCTLTTPCHFSESCLMCKKLSCVSVQIKNKTEEQDQKPHQPLQLTRALA
jgi:hypothetical protein